MSNELTHNPGQFDEVIHIIDNARSRAMKAVNAELIQMYWSVGEYLSELCTNAEFGDKIIDDDPISKCKRHNTGQQNSG
jgi:hypothetical protein